MVPMSSPKLLKTPTAKGTDAAGCFYKITERMHAVMSTMIFECPEELDVVAGENETPTPLESFETKPVAVETAEPAGETAEPTQSAGEPIGAEIVGMPPATTEAAVPVEPSTPPTAPAPASTPTKPELISSGVYEWRTSCERIEREISDLVIERVGIQERNKSIRKRVDCLAEELDGLRKSGPQAIWRTPAAPLEPPARDAAATLPATTTGELMPVVASPSDPGSNEWRKAPVSELTAHGVKPNVLEKLAEASIETIGQLVDRQTEISQHREKWPKGIGAAKITQIEDAVIAWLTKNRDSAVFQQCQASQASQADKIDSPPANQSPAGQSSMPAQITENLPSADEWEQMSEAKIKKWIIDRSEYVLSGAAGDSEDSDCWESGSQAFNAGVPMIDCPYIPGREMDDWLRGWCNAFDLYKGNGYMGEPSDVPQANPPVTVPFPTVGKVPTSTAFSLDDL